MNNKNIENLYQTNKKDNSPALLDNLILVQAKNSCVPKQLKTAKNRNWLYSLSTAAVLIMSFSVILNLQHENGKIIAQPSYNDIDIGKTAIAQGSLSSKEIEETLYKAEAPKKVGAVIREQKNNRAGISQQNLKITHKEYIMSAPASVHLVEVESSIAEIDNSANILATSNMTDKQDSFKDSDYAKHKLKKTQKQRNSQRQAASNGLSKQITHLEQLIKQNKHQEALILLNKLKLSYPNYDFLKFDESILTN